MPGPTERVLTVLELLQARGRLTGGELAGRLGVDRRTVRRYMARLEAMGVPVTAEHGRDGAYLLVSGFKLPPMMFTGDEAVALAVGLLAARGLGLADGQPAAASAQAKLERVLPVGLRRRVRALAETVNLELSRPRAPLDNAALVTLSEASERHARVWMHYRGREARETEREFDPYGLAYRAGRWYAVGHCHLRRGVRSFRLDRVAAVRRLDVTFERPEGFDVLDHLRQSVALIPRAHAVEVLLGTDLATAQRELFAAFGVLEWTGEGVLLRSQADDLAWFARELARLPFPFLVCRPVALRRALTKLGRELLVRGEK